MFKYVKSLRFSEQKETMINALVLNVKLFMKQYGEQNKIAELVVYNKLTEQECLF